MERVLSYQYCKAVIEPHGGVTRRASHPLGTGDGPIRIVEYDDSWQSAYAAERDRLATLLPGIRIHHIGSTAVPGLAAKPVIDMIALVACLDATATRLTLRAGYHRPARFNANLRHRRFLCYPTLSHRTHHLHLVDEQQGVESCVLFRDRLRSNPQLAVEYTALKRGLAERFKGDRMRYTEAKSTFIQHALRDPTEGTR